MIQRCGGVAVALLLGGCTFSPGPPDASDLKTSDGHARAVVFLRLLAEVDGQSQPAFSSSYSVDSIWLGWGDFATGGKLRQAPLGFFSAQTRKSGWTYLLLEPGIHYLAPNTPQNGTAFDYDASWAALRPCWRVEVPRNTPAVYAGTLFVAGEGSALIFGGRRLHTFDPQRFAIRDEPGPADAIYRNWLADFGPMVTRLAQRHSPSEPITLETPPDR